MAKFAFILRVREGMESEYRRLHDPTHLWPAIIDACQRAGLSNYTGFIGGEDGRTVFAVFDSEDPEAALQRLAEDPANSAWQEHMAPYLETEVAFGSGSMMILQEVFHIA